MTSLPTSTDVKESGLLSGLFWSEPKRWYRVSQDIRTLCGLSLCSVFVCLSHLLDVPASLLRKIVQQTRNGARWTIEHFLLDCGTCWLSNHIRCTFYRLSKARHQLSARPSLPQLIKQSHCIGRLPFLHIQRNNASRGPEHWSKKFEKWWRIILGITVTTSHGVPSASFGLPGLLVNFEPAAAHAPSELLKHDFTTKCAAKR